MKFMAAATWRKHDWLKASSSWRTNTKKLTTLELLESDWADHTGTGTVAEVRYNRQQLLQSTRDITTRS